MGLLTVLKKLKQKEKEIRILMLGLDNAGKTTILKRINGEDISTISPTLGFNIKTLVHNGYKLNIWDVGGQKSIRSYWRNYFEQTDGLVWVVDSADRPDRLEDCRRELHSLLLEERLAGASLLIFANKQDLSGALSYEQIEELLDLRSIQTHHWHIIGCSAVTGANLLAGMDWIVSDIASRIYMLE
ncbi:ADP-ribosylation factor-like protein 2 [Spizellomyces punctatus DAOM BR117]|uniref:ADP-ribosylation factor-like protein 2 n=1 Tax=Spizellomyces punctatus (strain DAOM BR117) TaxID=645134 RepID=A0A0L0HLD3_SPIPD|nr:ADP-ribosylation factor-like protein 2 [Spizellomyces punctatus DAOM BR117]KND01705.1 ADP-ribosylation factor-like protein 2 [Spizellomyces punctatus DAOM BR117]|eukprot:XP_016609744.1 ADP-ribosylation factor-like protein 2 [Spizellomyces punctatus DAOM BR117]